MAEHVSRSRHTPVARFNTFEVSEDEIKTQIERASKQQQALRAECARLWYSRSATCSSDQEHGLQSMIKSPPRSDNNSFDCPTRSGSLNTLVNSAAGHSLDRTPSFDSMSTLQRQSEAARLSQYRDSPVSAFTSLDRTSATRSEALPKIEDPCPPLTVYTLKQARKDEKAGKRDLKRQQKNAQSADQASNKCTKSVSADGSAKPQLQKKAPLPARAVSDPSFKRSKDAAAQLVKKLTMHRPMSRLTKRNKVQQPASSIPHIDDFDSKSGLESYLNSSLPEPKSQIAELPGPLPPYTLFQNCTSNAHNVPIPVSSEAPSGTPLLRSHSVPNHQHQESPQPPRMMRCDDCQFGIRLEEPYFQCSICNNGDRILCGACDAAGRSCRHELTERVRRVLRYDDGVRQSSSLREVSRRDLSRRETRNQPLSKTPLLGPAANFELQSTPKDPKSADLEVNDNILEARELELRKREQDVIIREKEASLREREADLRAREAELNAKARETESVSRGDFMRQCMEMAACLGSQFASLSRAASNASSSAGSPDEYCGAEQIILKESTATAQSVPYNDEGLRSYAGKRKAGSGQRHHLSTASPDSRSRDATRSSNARGAGNQDDLDGDDAESGTPKRMKQDPAQNILPEKLFACHYCKKDSLRYSENNNQEKNYRGCSSGYWPDISRLKQHLYRVHWRGRHCRICYAVFKTDEELDNHRKQPGQCTAQDCPYVEKFDEGQYNEIKRKRPAKGAEEVWYIIWDVLFPRTSRPPSPFQTARAAMASARPLLSPPQLTLETLGTMFEQRLNSQTTNSQQPWLQDPTAREWIHEQLRASMSDFMNQMQPHSAASSDIPVDHSPVDLEMRRPSVQLSEAPSLSASPQPMSATAERSPSCGQFLLPSHRRSFSRPLPNRNQSRSEHSFDEQTTDSALTSAMDTTPSDVMFHAATPVDTRSDQWDYHSGSWSKGDETNALGISGFDFDFQPGAVAKSYRPLFVDTDMTCPPNVNRAWFAGRSGRAATMPYSSQGVAQSTFTAHQSEASLDSGYGSLGKRSRPQSTNWATTQPTYDAQPAHDAVPENELNLQALDVSFKEFMGAEMDDIGNVEGQNLSEYLYNPTETA